MGSVHQRSIYFLLLLSIVVGFYLWSLKFTKNFHIESSYYKNTHFQDSSLRASLLYDVTAAVLIFSNRNSFTRRETIRKSWAKEHKHVYFLISGLYCEYSPDQRKSEKCEPKDKTVSRDKIYIDGQEEITTKLSKEANVILMNTTDIYGDISASVEYGFNQVLQRANYGWIVNIDENDDVDLQTLEKYLISELDPTEETVIIQLMNCESVKLDSCEKNEDCKNMKPGYLSPFMCRFNQVVSRKYSNNFKKGEKSTFKYTYSNNKTYIRISDSTFIQSLQRENNLNFISTNGNKVNSEVIVLTLNLKESSPQIINKDAQYTLMENPSLYLNTDRFDVVVKMVYAYYYAFEEKVPPVFSEAYKEHLRVWNHFKEGCSLKKVWFDSKIECKLKKNSSDFVSAFQNTIRNIKNHGFNSERSRIPVDKNGFLLNGAHRISSSVILSRNASFEHQTYAQHFGWGYNFFKSSGLAEKYFKIVMLEWMKIQRKLPNLKTHVSIVSIFSNNNKKDEAMRKIVKSHCSKDNGILYETNVDLTKKGARQLISHMYGRQSWLEAKIQQMIAKFDSVFKARFLFIYARTQSELVQCKTEIRKLYNDKVFKSTAHIPDNLEENLILAQMILNPNSVQFMNYAENANDCKLIAAEIASRASKESIKTLPGIYIGRDDVMVDSGTVLGFFGLRKRTDVDLLFANEIDKTILGNRNKVSIQVHAFKNNSISSERAWGEDHFKVKGVKDKWDLFYDPDNFGYCYGIKFVSLTQLIRYKSKRNEPNKDMLDVELINNFLNTSKV